MTNGTARWLSPHDAPQEQVAIDGDHVVWRDERNGNEDIYYYDLATGQESPLSTASGSQNSPEIDGGYVVYTDSRHGNDEIYLASVPVLAQPAVTVPGAVGAPRDLNGDGKYEDVNGNGRKDFADVVLFFNQMGWISTNEPIAAFDYNSNGRIDFADATRLFNNL
jgi:beta propeller repeat protein